MDSGTTNWDKEKQYFAEFVAGCNTVETTASEIIGILRRMKSAAASHAQIDPKDISEIGELTRKLPEHVERFIERRL